MDQKSDARERELHDLDVEFVRRHRNQVSHERAGSSLDAFQILRRSL
jgi:hypothetical protein